MTTEHIPQLNNPEQSASNVALQIERKLSDEYGPEFVEELRPVIGLAAAAHEGHNGLDGKPLALHSADVTLSPELTTIEEWQLGLLHDAATPGYTNFTPEEFVEKARAAGCSEMVIAGALCFDRPKEGWDYDDWVSLLKRVELTRKTKMADSDACIANFPPASENQLAAWKRTRQRLADNGPESPDVTARIEASMKIHPMPDLRAIGQPGVGTAA